MDAENANEIRRQIEFYFSDSNLFRDKFLMNLVKANADGFVELHTLCTFSRMQKLLDASPHGEHKMGEKTSKRNLPVVDVKEEHVEYVAQCLQDSDSLVLSEDNRHVRRADPLTKSEEEFVREVDARSLFASPFPFDETLDSLLTFFKQNATVNSIRFRRHSNSKDFKGSIFLELATPEEAERVRNLSLVYAGAPIRFERKEDFIKRKGEENEKRKAQKISEMEQRVNGAGKRPREEDVNGDAEREDKPIEPVSYTPGCVLEFHFGDASFGDQVVTFGLVKDSFGGKEAGLKFVDYVQGEKVGQARFESPEAAQKAMEEASTSTDEKGEERKTRLIAGFEAAIKILEGKEEEEFHRRVQAAREKKSSEDHRGKGNKSRGRGRGRGGSRSKRPRRN